MNQILSIPSQVGVVLRAARKGAKLSQAQLAAKIGLSQNRVSQLETDPSSMRVDQLLAIMAALGLELQAKTREGPPITENKSVPTDSKAQW